MDFSTSKFFKENMKRLIDQRKEEYSTPSKILVSNGRYDDNVIITEADNCNSMSQSTIEMVKAAATPLCAVTYYVSYNVVEEQIELVVF